MNRDWRLSLLRIAVFAAVGATLGDAGITVQSIHFWIVMLLILIYSGLWVWELS